MKVIKSHITGGVRSIIEKRAELPQLNRLVIEAQHKVEEKAKEIADTRILLAQNMKDEECINVHLGPGEIIQVTKRGKYAELKSVPIHINDNA